MNCPDNPAGYARASAPRAGVPEPTASGEPSVHAATAAALPPRSLGDAYRRFRSHPDRGRRRRFQNLFPMVAVLAALIAVLAVELILLVCLCLILTVRCSGAPLPAQAVARWRCSLSTGSHGATVRRRPSSSYGVPRAGRSVMEALLRERARQRRAGPGAGRAGSAPLRSSAGRR